MKKIENGNFDSQGKDGEEACPICATMDMIGGKWSLPIIHTLMEGTMRFKELERGVEGINTRMLVKELKSLEQKGVVKRVAYATVPPTVEYSLTPKGMELKPIMQAIHTWATKHGVGRNPHE